jgi:hypothetical protein
MDGDNRKDGSIITTQLEKNTRKEIDPQGKYGVPEFRRAQGFPKAGHMHTNPFLNQ